MTPRAVYVVVPARDEELLLGRCLRAVARAVAHLEAVCPAVEVVTLVVLDSCVDGSAAVAAGAGVRTLTVDAGAVGAARRTGVAWAQTDARRRGLDHHDVWVAGTDADTEVPTDWLTAQVGAAAAGHNLVVGPALPEDGVLTPDERAAWDDRHRPEMPHARPHVHGANLGVRLSTFLAAGGFADVAEHEDAGLVERILGAGGRWSPGPPVVTSARLDGRTPGGFAGYLRDLRRDLAAGTLAHPTG